MDQLKLFTDITDILKICMKNFDGHRLIFDNFTGALLSFGRFVVFSASYADLRLCSKLLI